MKQLARHCSVLLAPRNASRTTVHTSALWVPPEKPLFLFQLINLAADSSFTPLKPIKKGKFEEEKHLEKQPSNKHQNDCTLHALAKEKKTQYQ